MSAEVHILGAGLSGLSSATILAKAGKDVHVHEIRLIAEQGSMGTSRASRIGRAIDFFES